MPTSYAHYKFGQKVVEKLPEKYQYFAYEYPEYFYPALHGPDLCFYNVLKPSLPRLGNQLHEMSGKEYFTMVGDQILAEMNGLPLESKSQSLFPAEAEYLLEAPIKAVISVLHKLDRKGVQPQSILTGHYGNDDFGRWADKQTERKLAYLFGFLLHYALDRTAHKYVNEQVERGTASHFTIEAEFDRLLLSMDGYNPLRHPVTGHIHPSLEVAENIKQFFPGTTTLDLYNALLFQKVLLLYFSLPGRLPRKLYVAVTERLGLSTFTDLYMTEEPVPRCFETNDQLNRILNDTVDEGVEFVTTLLDRLNGKLEWDDRFNWNFDGDYVESPRLK